MDFMPYEGAPLKGGSDLKRLTVTVAIGVVILGGAVGLAAFSPVSSTSSVGQARVSAPSPVVDNVALSDRDLGPGEAESELASLPVAAR